MLDLHNQGMCKFKSNRAPRDSLFKNDFALYNKPILLEILFSL